MNPQEQITADTESLFRQRYSVECHRMNRFMVWLMVFQWCAGIAFAMFYSPYTWIGDRYEIHIHVWAAAILGGAISGAAILSVLRFPDASHSRHVMACAQVLWSALLIHLSGGRIETHFHVFASLAILSVYRDWKILITATVVVAVDHLVRGIWYPLSAFGVATESPFRWIEHALWVVFEIAFLVPGCMRLRDEIRELCRGQVELEWAKKTVDQQVEERTCELLLANGKLAGEIKERESAQARETRLGRIIEHSLNEIYVFDKETLLFREVNRGALVNLGYSIDEMQKLTPLHLKPRLDSKSFAELVQPLIDGTLEVLPFETIHRRKDGSLYPVEVHLQLAEWDAETVFVAMILDISKRQSLQSERDRFQKQLVDASRKAGMAEIATGVLHNVGNVLNSVNVSAGVIEDYLGSDREAKLVRAAGMITGHRDDLSDFLMTDARGKHFPEYLEQTAGTLLRQKEALLEEVHGLVKNIGHIKDIVSMQQTHAKNGGIAQDFGLHEVIADAVKISESSLDRHGVYLSPDYQLRDDCIMTADKHKVLQILVNLISNAKHAVDRPECEERTVVLDITREGEEFVKITIDDTGVGIKQEHIAMLFQHGFTTKKDGHGFGLHSSANAAKLMGGELTAHSDGPGCGAQFTLTLPVSAAGPKACGQRVLVAADSQEELE